MRDLIYRGGPPVRAAETQALLTGPFAAVWAPPTHRHAGVVAGDRVWLIWQGIDEAPILLGVGVVYLTPAGSENWTNATARGIVAAARALGYGGPTNMAFLRLNRVWVPAHPPEAPGTAPAPSGLSAASVDQVAVLAKLLPF